MNDRPVKCSITRVPQSGTGKEGEIEPPEIWALRLSDGERRRRRRAKTGGEGGIPKESERGKQREIQR